jgi:RNA polymerase sigma-70 factor, ECF subfamily
LPTSFRSVMVLSQLQEYTIEEAAVELGISVTAVKSRVTRARRLLRNRLREKPDFP